MKAKSLCLCSSLVYILCACGEPAYNYAYEQQLLDCYYRHLEETGNKEKIALEELEEVYIKYGILKNKSARSYIRFIENLKNPDAQRILYNKRLIKDLLAINNLPSGIVCRDEMYADSSGLANSKFRYIASVMDSIEVEGDIAPDIISKAILTHFEMKDFENEFYKVTAMIMLANFIIQQDKMENGVLLK